MGPKHKRNKNPIYEETSTLRMDSDLAIAINLPVVGVVAVDVAGLEFLVRNADNFIRRLVTHDVIHLQSLNQTINQGSYLGPFKVASITISVDQLKVSFQSMCLNEDSEQAWAQWRHLLASQTCAPAR